MPSKLLKILSFGSLLLIIPMLGTATVLEKIYGSAFAWEHIYVALPVIVLWGLATFCSLLYILKQRLYRQPFTFCLHLSLAVILVGALITHLSGKEGKIHLRMQESPVSRFVTSDGEPVELPFYISLLEFHPEYYPGTSAPSDFVSFLFISDKIGDANVDYINEDNAARVTVSMNKIVTYNNYRLYQSGYDADEKGTFLTVSRDPYGMAVTYTGYCWLLFSIVGFFFQKKSMFCRILRNPVLGRGLTIVIFLSGLSVVHAAPPSLPKESADRFCDLYVYYNDRITPLHTLARDFTIKIYGKDRYAGLTSEQVLTGWLFYYDAWKREPVIKIKNKEIEDVLKKNGEGQEKSGFVSLIDFNDVSGYKLENLLREDGPFQRAAIDANEKFNLISTIATGSMLNIYPYNMGDALKWYSLADRPAEEMPYDQWLFIRGSMDIVAEKVALKDFKGVDEILSKIKKYQLKEGKTLLPSDARFNAEVFYYRYNSDKPLAMMLLTVGTGLFFFFIFRMAKGRKISAKIMLISFIIQILAFIYLSLQLGLRWYVSGHIPVSNGFETMQFMAWCALLCGMISMKRFPLSVPFSLLISGFAVLVAMLVEASPKITNLMPVLQSPLLSVHVMVIMISYTLLAFIALNGIAGLIMQRSGEISATYYIALINRLLLYPAVFLLAAGIFIGAVWANISWGRYWGWDPKEVWALITFLIYSFAFHTHSLKIFRNTVFFHLYSVISFLSVIVTYFGVNFILGGIHSYA